MSAKEHEKQISNLRARHEAVLAKFGSLQPANLDFWRHKGITTPQQLQFLGTLIEQVEASHAAVATSVKNLNSALEIVIEANTRAR